MDSERVSRAGSVKLPHSHSTPAGVDGGGGTLGARTPPATPKKGGKMLAVRVQMLDDSITMFQVQAKATGRLLFEQVCKQLHLLEADYFGLEYQEHSGTRYWLDLEKPLSRQVGLTLVDTLLRFCVKFYTPDPAQLEEEFTRYLYCLQVKRDLCQGLLQCNDNTAALMASYIVQAECGDYVHEDYPDHTYLSTYKFTPTQDHELERRIMENHKKHAGQSPAEADLNLLETSRRCELYGMKMHAAKDHEGVPLNLAVAHMGIVVFQNYTKINTFSWAKIRKISFKRKRFLVKLHPEGYGYYKDTVEFFFEGRNECKNFWKKCVENHGFFRCSMVKRVPRQKTRVLSRGSSFRYSGKTQKQIVEFVRENYVKRQTFQRSQSFRHSNSVHSSVANVGQSLSAHPLLPLGENAVVGTQASLSCGSMTLTSDHRRRSPSPPSPSPTHTADVHPSAMGGSPSPPLTSQSSVTSSPQHFYPARRERDAAIAACQDSPPAVNGDLDTPPSPRAASTPRHNGTVPSAAEHHIELSPVVAVVQPKAASESDLTRQKDADLRRRKYLNDKGYFIAKEFLMTERTYKKDLEVLILWFRDEVSKEESEMPDETMNLLFALVDPVYSAHCALLRDAEQRLAAWEGRGTGSGAQKIADVLLKHLDMLPLYEDYLGHHLTLLEQLNSEFHRNRKFEQLYRDFELQKVCYLPLTSFILKPLQRLLHYQHLLDRLASYYDKDHLDYEDCVLARTRLEETANQVPLSLRQSENFVQLCELQRDMSGFDSLVLPGRDFLRQGCLLKQSRKGYQQRMFFLFSDVLLYTNRAAGPSLQFRVHGQMPLRGVMVEEGDSNIDASTTGHTFTIYGGNRAISVAASSQSEKDKWLGDLRRAMAEARERSASIDGRSPPQYPSLKSISSSDEVVDRCGIEEKATAGEKARQTQRSNTAVHVCWHRNTSLGMEDQMRATQNQLSGYLLRKFKNSNGWQKLWVVFTNFCLFFYKTFQDDFPLASLPLLSYSVGPPSEQDAIHKDFVFKLQFKNHLYFFRAESEYTFSRWIEVISSATQQPFRPNLSSKVIDWDAPY